MVHFLPWYQGVQVMEMLTWCPAVCYLKYDLYDLVDKQKKVKIDSYKALLNYWLCFTNITAQLQVSNQLLSIEKDDLFLEGFDQEFQGKILQRLKWNDQRQYADDPWPTCQNSLKLSKVPGEGSRSQVVEVDSIEVAVAEIPSIKLQDAEDEQRAVAHALKVPKPTLEPRGDLHKVPEQAGSIEVKEIRLEVEAEGQSKVVAWRKPPEAEIQGKILKSVSQRIKEILPEFWITHSSAGMDSESQCRDLCDKPNDAAMKIYASLPQKSKNCLFKGYEVYRGKVQCSVGVIPMLQVKAPHSAGWSTILKSTAISSTQKPTEEAISEVRTPEIMCKKKWIPPCVEGEVIWSATLIFQSYEAGDRVKAKPRAPLALGTRPE
ncbi:hypothetical protein EV401DRAFT_1896284 [Pisolithus croceorrhizus]|nr:hypothetical protein EV401DRAFT_1896284 [Pisolithus croceorrhizus]